MTLDRIGRYEVERSLGSGAFASVWLAYDEALDARVAIKVLADNWIGDTNIRRRFAEEARILWRLDSDRIVRVFSVDELPGGQPYFVMEYADLGSLGERLADRHADGRPYSIDEALEISLAMAEGLAVAHGLHIVHRDLKPSNVLFRSVPAHHRQTRVERMLLADFGIARSLENAGATTMAAGTPHYMAPEQFAGHADERSDIYAAVIVLYELLAGRVPFPYDSIGQVIRAQLTETPTPIQELRHDVPPALGQLIERGLKVDPEERLASADELTADLRRLLEDRDRQSTAPVQTPAPMAPVPVPPVGPVPTEPGPAEPASPLAETWVPPDRTVTGIAASSPAAPVVAPEALAVEPEPTAAPRPWWRRAPVLVGAGAIVVAAVVAAVAAWPGGGGHTRVQTLTQPSVSQTVAPSTTTSPPVTFAPPALREALLQTPFPITLVPASFVFYGPGTLGDYRGGKLAASPNQHLPPITPDNRFRYVGDAQIYLNRPVPRPQQTAFWTIQYWVFADEAGAQAWEVDSGRFFQIARVGNVEIRITWGTTDNQGYGAEQQNADQAVLFIAAKTFLAQVRATAT